LRRQQQGRYDAGQTAKKQSARTPTLFLRYLGSCVS
jgi:hypothetical protein